MIDRCLFPGTFADILAHLWMNKVPRTQLLKERNFLAVRALDFFVCGAVRELVAPVSGVILNQCFSVRRRHELWQCLVNNFITHEHTKKAAHLVHLAHELWD